MSRSSGGTPSWSWLATTAAGLARHPELWTTACRKMVLLAPSGWWKRAPFLPLPDRDYLAFRNLTMYGESDHRPPLDDVVTYLRWCKAFEGAI